MQVLVLNENSKMRKAVPTKKQNSNMKTIYVLKMKRSVPMKMKQTLVNGKVMKLFPNNTVWNVT